MTTYKVRIVRRPGESRGDLCFEAEVIGPDGLYVNHDGEATGRRSATSSTATIWGSRREARKRIKAHQQQLAVKEGLLSLVVDEYEVVV